jgi:ABC-type multidrug transport system fused ATPase/permease subunit
VCVDVEMPLTESNEGKVPPASWPSHGAVSFKKLCVTYAPELPDVLLNVSFDIEPGMRVGIVGTTGSGKSTLALTLFRAMDPRDGSIEIDGEDIAGVRLKELRKRLNMVVQDGSLNSGTLRDALDITHSKGKIIASIRTEADQMSRRLGSLRGASESSPPTRRLGRGRPEGESIFEPGYVCCCRQVFSFGPG